MVIDKEYYPGNEVNLGNKINYNRFDLNLLDNDDLQLRLLNILGICVIGLFTLPWFVGVYQIIKWIF